MRRQFLLVVATVVPGIAFGAGLDAQRILNRSGVQGGLIVHLGCGDGQLTAALRVNDRYLVQGLDTEHKHVSAARKTIQSLGLYGQVTAETFDGKHLPYVDNLVNLIVADELAEVSREEIARMLAPGGVVVTLGSGHAVLDSFQKPWPHEMDEWTHWLHDADGNPVSLDELLGPPRRLQWTAAPLWSRNHHMVPSVSTMVSAKGRLFYILDEGPIGVGGPEPNLDHWSLMARDAFNGVLLWKRRMPKWGWSQWTTQWYGRFNQPHQLAKRLVARGDTVYVTLDYGGPVLAIDAESGKTTKVYEGTEGADEILLHDGLMVLACDIDSIAVGKEARRRESTPSIQKKVCVVDADSGRILWEKKGLSGVHSYGGSPAGRLGVVVGTNMLSFLDAEHIIGLDLRSGEELWRFIRPKPSPKGALKRAAKESLPAAELAKSFVGRPKVLATSATVSRKPSAARLKASERCVLVYAEGTVLYAQLDSLEAGYHSYPGHLYAISAESGKLLWKHRIAGWAHQLLPEVFVIDDLVWVHKQVDVELTGKNGGKTGAQKWPVGQSEIPYAVLGIDIRSGEVVKEISTREIFNVGHHHRCYRGTATKRFLLTARRGLEFTDLNSGVIDRNHWARSGCLFGGIPSNGLVYTTPHPCSCYINAQLTGFFALAPSKPKASVERPDSPPTDPRDLIERGPGFGKTPHSAFPTPRSTDWPTFRHDNQRSGHSSTPLPSELSELWQTKIGGKLSALVIAEGRVFASVIDEHRIESLNAQTGKRLWSYVVGARVDSPPTVCRGLAVFGCRDGWVYCLRAEDGRLVWRRRLAPGDRQVGAFGQLESAWPVHGSVLVQDGVVYATAGRSSYLDHGILAYAMSIETGEVIEQRRLYSLDPQTGKMAPQPEETRNDARTIEGYLSDILTGGAESVWMRGQRVFGTAEEDGGHYHPTPGFLDDSWFDRVGTRFGGLKVPSQLLVFDQARVIGMTAYQRPGKGSYIIPGTGQYLLSGAERKGPKSTWNKNAAIRIRSMVLADETLFAASFPDRVSADAPFANFEGRGGGVLGVFSSSDGEGLRVYPLESPPVWDGMAAANSKLYIATTGGGILCLGN